MFGGEAAYYVSRAKLARECVARPGKSAHSACFATRGEHMSKLAGAKELAEEWAWQAEEERRVAAQCAHFDGCTPLQLIGMWETGKNLEGQPLGQWQVQALAEAWCRVFGELPPDDDASDGSGEAPDPEPPQPEPELPADDTMLRTKDVLRLMGLSRSTLKRMVIDGRFPKPMRLSPRRLGWPARDVKAWLDAAESARAKSRY
jgi:prophage regulatory protein